MQAKFRCPCPAEFLRSGVMSSPCDWICRSSFALLRHLTSDHGLPRPKAQALVLEAIAAKQAGEVFPLHPDYLEG